MTDRPRRRRLSGRPLLLAGAGASMMIAGCADKSGETEYYVSGNLMPPPQVELCVTVAPPEAEATVTANGQELPDADPSCATVYEGSISVTATAEGYAPHEEVLEVYADTTHKITLSAEEE